jgi:hypothetical protein
LVQQRTLLVTGDKCRVSDGTGGCVKLADNALEEKGKQGDDECQTNS